MTSVRQSWASFLGFQFGDVAPVVYGVFECEETCSALVGWGDFGCHVLRHMGVRRLRISISHCERFMIDNVDVVKFRVAMAIHWSSPQRGSLLCYHLKRG